MIQKQLLTYNNKLDQRELSSIDTIVLHCTELPDLEMAREYGEKIHYNSGTGNCGHYYISKTGETFQWVEDDRIAHHVAGHNPNTLGIELDNLGRFPYWLRTNYQIMYDPYPEEQIQSLIRLIQGLVKKMPQINNIIGHEDLDQRLIPSENDPTIFIRRKMDPGPMFPWERILKHFDLNYSGNYGKLK